MAKINYELDVVNFVRIQMKTRSLLKQLITVEKKVAATNLKSYLDSDQQSASDDSEMQSDPFSQADRKPRT